MSAKDLLDKYNEKYEQKSQETGSSSASRLVEKYNAKYGDVEGDYNRKKAFNEFTGNQPLSNEAINQRLSILDSMGAQTTNRNNTVKNLLNTGNGVRDIQQTNDYVNMVNNRIKLAENARTQSIVDSIKANNDTSAVTRQDAIKLSNKGSGYLEKESNDFEYTKPELTDSVKAPNIEKTPNPYEGLSEEERNKKIVEDFEAIPNYNVFQRAGDIENNAYNKKQSMFNDYKLAKNEQTKQILEANGITDDDMRAFVDTSDPRHFEVSDRLYELTVENNTIDLDALKYYTDDFSIAQASKDALIDKAGNTAGTWLVKPFEDAFGAVTKGYNYVVGKPINNDPTYSSIVRDAISEKIGNRVGQIAYGGLNSFADMGVAMGLGYATGGGSIVSAGVQALEKANEVMNESSERGLTPNQIMAEGVASGVTTYVTEKIPLDKLADIATNGLSKYTATQIARSIISQIASEGTQEASEDVADWIADALIAGDKSQWNLDVKNYIKSGLTEKEAVEKVIQDRAMEALIDAGVGGAIGGVTGSVSVGVAYANGRGGSAPSVNTDAVVNSAKATNELLDATSYLNKETNADLLGRIDGKTAEELTKEDIIDISNALQEEASNNKEVSEELTQKINEINYDSELATAVKEYEENGKIERSSGETKTEKLAKDTVETETKKIERAEKVDKALDKVEDYIGKKIDKQTIRERFESKLSDSVDTAPIMRAFNTFNDGTIDNNAYERIFNTSLEYAKRNAPLEMAYESASINSDKLTLDTFRQIYTATLNYVSELNKASTSESQLNTVFKMASNRDVNVKFISPEESNGILTNEDNGIYNPKDNTIYLSKNATSPLTTVFAHEFVHWLSANDKATYETLDKVGRQWLSIDKATYNTVMSNKRASYKNMGYSNADLREEINAYMTEAVMQKLGEMSETEQRQFVEKTIRENPESKSFFSRLLSQLKEWVSNIRKNLKGYKAEHLESKTLYKNAEALENFMNVLSEALAGNTENAVDIANNAVAERTAQSIATDTVKNGFSDSEQSEGNIMTDTVLKMNLKTYEDEENGGKLILSKWLETQEDLSEEDKMDILDSVDQMAEIARKYADDENLIDFGSWNETDIIRRADGSAVLSVVVPNGDYPLNIDFSTICKKRKALNKILNALVRSGDLNTYTLTQSDIGTINRIIKEHGFEIACGLCFVDSKRYRSGAWAESFTDMYNKMVESLTDGTNYTADNFNYTNRSGVTNPTENILNTADDSELNWDYINDVMSKYNSGTEMFRIAQAIKENPSLRSILSPSELIANEGLDTIKAQNNTLYQLVNSHQGSAKPKLSHSETPYASDILLRDDFNAKDAYKVGGVRIQSFSDYMANMFFDYVQMIGDLSAKKLPSHAYTKESAFARIFGKTGVKINMSLVARGANLTEEQTKLINKMRYGKLDKKSDEYKLAKKLFDDLKSHAGLDAEGNYIWEDETFNYDEAMAIRSEDGYDKNVGTIAVGISRPHILKLLNDSTIDMVIPYHKSSINPVIAKMRNIDFYNDYTKKQNTRYVSSGKKVPSKQITFDFYEDLAKTNDPKKTADNYLKYCDEHDFIPKFDEFREEGNYYKLLADFRLYDSKGEYAPQSAVKTLFPDNVSELVGESLKDAQETSSKFNADTESLLSDIKSELGLGIKKNLKASDERYMEAVDDNDTRTEQRLVDVKSADPVTYDDNGNVIPLSKRFDSNNNDIRKSKTTSDNNTEELSKFLTDRSSIINWDSYGKELFDEEIELYSKYQKGIADETNFFKNTVAIFEERKNRPRRTPDYVSYSRGETSSEYWYTSDGVIRGSSHWGEGIRSCDWALRSDTKTFYGSSKELKVNKTSKRYGFCKWEDFLYKTEIKGLKKNPTTNLYTDVSEAYLTSFDSVKNENIMESKKTSKNSGFYDVNEESATKILEEGFKALETIEINQYTADRIAEKLLKDYGSTFSKEELSNSIRSIFAYAMKNKKNANWGDLTKIAYEVAVPVLKQSEHQYSSTDAFNFGMRIYQEYFKMLGRKQTAYKVEKAIERVENKYKKKEKNAKERKDITELRQSIYSKKNRLDSLLKPTKSMHIPKDLVYIASELASMINKDDARLSYKAVDKLNELKLRYEAIRNDEDFASVYDEEVARIVDTLANSIKGRTIEELTKSELESVNTVLNSILTMIKNENEFLDKSKSQTIASASTKGINEVNSTKGFNDKNFITRFTNSYNSVALNFERLLRRSFGYTKNSEGEWISKRMKDAELQYIQDTFEAESIFSELTKDAKTILDFTGRKNRGTNIDTHTWIKIPNVDGTKTVSIPKSMRLSLIMHLLNDDNLRHVAYGGFTIPNVEDYRRNQFSKAYQRGDNFSLNFFNDDDIKMAREASDSFGRYQENTDANMLDKEPSFSFRYNPENPYYIAYKEASDKVKNYRKSDGVSKEQLIEERDAKFRELEDARKEADETLDRLIAERRNEYVEKLMEGLSEYEKDFLEATKHFFYDYSSGKLNETSMNLYGYKKATVKNYFPIKVDANTLGGDQSGIKFDGTLEGSGFMKERVKSKKPILLEDVTNVITRHIEQISKFHGYAEAIHDVKSILNYSANGNSLRSSIARKWDTMEMIDRFISDIESPRGEKSFISPYINKLRSNFAGATLTGNLGVAMKQASSFPTAVAELGWDNAVKALLKNPMFMVAPPKAISEIESRTPLLKYREKGYVNQELGEIKDMKANNNKLYDAFANLITGVDVRTVRALEYGAVAWADKYTDFEKGSDEYWDAVTEKFNDTIRRTQPNYTTLERPELLRDPNSMLRTLFMFKTQPLQNYGILYDAFGELSAMQREYKANQSEENLNNLKEAQKKAFNAVSSNIMSQAVFSAMTILAKMIYHAPDDDWFEEDENGNLTLNWKKLGIIFANGILSSEFGMFPIASELYEYLSTKALKKAGIDASYYGFSDSLVDMFNDVTTGTDNFFKAIDKLATAETTAEKQKALATVGYRGRTLATKVGAIFGIPVNNVYKLLNSIASWTEDIVNQDFLGSDGFLNYDSVQNVPNQYELMNKALEEDNTAKYDKLMKEQMDSTGKEESEVYFELNKKRTGTSSEYDYLENLLKEASTGGDKTAVVKEVETLIEYGKKPNNIRDALKKRFADEKMTPELNQVLRQALRACGYTDDEAKDIISKW